MNVNGRKAGTIRCSMRIVTGSNLLEDKGKTRDTIKTNGAPSAVIMKILNIALPTIAVAFLAFLAGSYVMFSEAGPAGFLSNAYKAGQALVDQQTNYRHPYFSRFHQKRARISVASPSMIRKRPKTASRSTHQGTISAPFSSP